MAEETGPAPGEEEGGEGAEETRETGERAEGSSEVQSGHRQ